MAQAHCTLDTFLTYVITPWCRILIEKLTGPQPAKKFPAFHGTRRFITAFTRHLSLSWASSIILDTSGYKYTLRECNIYRFSTAIMVARTRLNVTLNVHCLAYLLSHQSAVHERYGSITNTVLSAPATYCFTTKYKHKDVAINLNCAPFRSLVAQTKKARTKMYCYNILKNGVTVTCG